VSAVLFLARQYEESEAAARRALSLAPGRPAVHFAIAGPLLQRGRGEEALAECDLETIAWQRMTCRSLAFPRIGKADLARTEMAAMLKAFGDAASYQYAQISVALGDRDAAFRWLATARRIHDPGLMGQVYVDPLLDGLRSDPRYDALIQELGFSSGA
jgi:predicted Zn-dependent protease